MTPSIIYLVGVENITRSPVAFFAWLLISGAVAASASASASSPLEAELRLTLGGPSGSQTTRMEARENDLAQYNTGHGESDEDGTLMVSFRQAYRRHQLDHGARVKLKAKPCR